MDWSSSVSAAQTDCVDRPYGVVCGGVYGGVYGVPTLHSPTMDVLIASAQHELCRPLIVDRIIMVYDLWSAVSAGL
jgi:hypothetical protein